MGGEDEHLGYLDMSRGIGGIDGNIGNIVACEGLDALIELSGSISITTETDIAEVGLYQAWLQVCNTNGSIGYIDAQAVGQGFYCGFRSTIDIAASIGCIACH